MWSLITVTNGGSVNISAGYPTKSLCEEAKSIALTGMTIEQNNEADAVYEKAQADWEASHPWREPKNKSEAALSKFIGSSSNGYNTLISDGHGKVRDGYPSGGMSMSYNPNDGESVQYVRGGYRLLHKTDIKYAHCIPPEPKE